MASDSSGPSLSVQIHIKVNIDITIHVSVLSLSIYIYIFIHIKINIDMNIHVCIHMNAKISFRPQHRPDSRWQSPGQVGTLGRGARGPVVCIQRRSGSGRAVLYHGWNTIATSISILISISISTC